MEWTEESLQSNVLLKRGACMHETTSQAKTELRHVPGPPNSYQMIPSVVFVFLCGLCYFWDAHSVRNLVGVRLHALSGAGSKPKNQASFEVTQPVELWVALISSCLYLPTQLHVLFPMAGGVRLSFITKETQIRCSWPLEVPKCEGTLGLGSGMQDAKLDIWVDSNLMGGCCI